MSEGDEFFVGYLPTPAAHRRWLRRAAVSLVVVGGLVGVALAAMQRDPGEGVWDLSEVKQMEGVLYLRPCPLVRVTGREGRGVSVLLVGEGKIGVEERLAGMDGRLVRVKGHTLTRGPVRLFEVEDGADGIAAVGDAGSAWPEVAARRAVTMRGEVVDPKCFAGAMKPGDGKTHKGCAVLCLRGGMPAVLAAENGVYLIVDEAGRALREAELEQVLPLVGEPVEASGDVAVWGDLRLFYLSTGSVRRL